MLINSVGIVLHNKWLLIELLPSGLELTAYKEHEICKGDCKIHAWRSDSESRANRAACIVENRHIQKVDNKWSGQHEVIGTCWVELVSDPLMEKGIILEYSTFYGKW